MSYMSIVVKSKGGYNFEVYEDLVYKDVTVPKGFVSNGANIPRMFWSVVPPNYMHILPAIAVHDYLCKKSEFEKADKYFREILKIQKVSRYKYNMLSSGVGAYSKIIRPTLKKFNMYKQDT